MPLRFSALAGVARRTSWYLNALLLDNTYAVCFQVSLDFEAVLEIVCGLANLSHRSSVFINPSNMPIVLLPY